MQDKGKILITDAVHPTLLDGLDEAGYFCEYLPEVDPQKVPDMMNDYVGIVINSKIKVDKLFLSKSPNLKFIARLGSGLEIIDLDAAREQGVLVHRSPDGNCDAVAEHALGMLLALSNNLCFANAEVKQKLWRREALRGWELMGKTVAIIGFGFTGKAFAKRLSGFNVEILVYDKYLNNVSKFVPYVIEADMNEVFEKADIVSLHLPLTSETKGLFSESYINRFKKPIVLINTARGEIVKTDALINGLNKEKITGACLDVFENEKPENYTFEQEKLFEDLFERKNIILSPHIAGWTFESKERLSKLLLERILDQSEML